ncbi:MAG: HAD hydrolase family protein [[Clostridium] leptum]
MQYRLLALDLDGTLVTSHGGITEAAKQAVWSYIDAGGVVALASGRPTRGLWPAQELRLAQKGGYLLSYNGGKIVNCKTGAAIYEKDIPQDLVPVIIRMIRDAGMEAISYQDQYVLLEHVDRLWFDREARCGEGRRPDLAAYVTFPVVKLMASAPEQILALEKHTREAGSRVDVFRSGFLSGICGKGIDRPPLEVLLKHLINRTAWPPSGTATMIFL